jgi:dTDP-4-amino-4,6-dideoxygalactose transaminase/predicted O-linked N-acetylglucosamine transferase (SPINDLY family)
MNAMSPMPAELLTSTDQQFEDDLAMVLSSALEHHNKGELDEALALYQAIIGAKADHAAANYNLGVLLTQTQRAAEALPYFETVLGLDPNNGQYWASYIDTLVTDNQKDAAWIALDLAKLRGVHGPGIDALCVRMASLGTAQKVPAATPESQAHVPPQAPTHTQAVDVVIAPKKAVAKPTPQQINQVSSLYTKGRFDEGVNASMAFCERFPESGVGFALLGKGLHRLGRFAEALPILLKAAEMQPDDIETRVLLGDLFLHKHMFAEGLHFAHEAVALNPMLAEPHRVVSAILCAQHRLPEAIAAGQRAVELAPNVGDMHGTLAVLYLEAGLLPEAEKSFRQALKLNPMDSVSHSNMLFCLTHKADMTGPELMAAHREFGLRHEAAARHRWPVHSNSKDPERVIRVGFVSADLFRHAVASYFEPVLERLANDDRLSIHVYYNFNVDDATTARLRAHADEWKVVAGVPDATLAKMIRADGIDILFDLSGHTGRNRLVTFAQKPAPVQVSWIGYPATTGLSAMDYYFADPLAIPEGPAEEEFIEKIVRLPAAAPFLPEPNVPPINVLPAMHNGYITFGSFNRLNKLSREVIALWATLLRRLPTSKMVVGSIPKPGDEATVKSWFAEEGIDASRVAFKPRAPISLYQMQLHQVDLCLDTFPYSGSTTTLYGLWMGVPTITIPAHTLASRASETWLSHVGLSQFVARDKDDFVERAVALTQDLPALNQLRMTMRERCMASAAFRPDVIATSVSTALRRIWQDWCEGKAPASFEVGREDETISKLAELEQAAATDVAPLVAATPVAAEKIYVTQPYLAPLADFVPYLEKIWESKFLTNGGPFHQQLEAALCEYLGVKHLALFSNGTLALLTALQALRITGEVITTPYSFVATAHSLLWNGIKPVFVDVDPVTLNMDPAKIEAAITPDTTAILPVHCYGRPCDVDAIQKIADNYNLKVIYDAAHAFGVKTATGSLLNHGDLSVLSFHATKVFNTFEGGAIICPDAKTKQRIDHLKNFGFVDEVTVVAAGINGKMSEINAAFGLLQLKHIDTALARRKEIDGIYRNLLRDIPGIRCLPEGNEAAANYAYFPVLVEPDFPLSRDGLYSALRDNEIFARRYFYPLISDFPMYRGLPSANRSNLPVAANASEKVLCLPIYPDLSVENINRIVGIIASR